tara:strand:- start:26290 stop:27819 length:1530 start_codon:yes stop_codon:yes gene_type:complete
MNGLLNKFLYQPLNLCIMKILRKIKLFSFFAMVMQINVMYSFCGFYVAKADASLFNKTSQVIFVRDGNRSVVTMSSDYEGDLSEFAMVVPVPELIKEQNIRIADQLIFQKLDAYSGARLVEYFDNSPCRQYIRPSYAKSVAEMNEIEDFVEYEEEYSVSVEAKYQIGEYDILILSAKESDGLQRWLTDNGYKIPEKAKEVLEPYIKNNMKFFVVKVNLEEQKKIGATTLRPIQMAFNSDKFMLPIRLGMANAKEEQDMIVYLFTKQGRVETTNYRTVNMPTDVNIPEFVQKDFGDFYKDMFEKQWKKEGKNIVFLEYAWDVSLKNYVKCDPCAGTPPSYTDLRESGVYWVTSPNDQDNVMFTRLHVRYDRKHFPQDLFFKQTPNKQNFQARYVLQHAYKGELSCDAAQEYYKKVLNRREKELTTLAALTGWDISDYEFYLDEIRKKIKESGNGWIEEDNFKNGLETIFIPGSRNNNKGNGVKWVTFIFLLIMMLVILHKSSMLLMKRES